MYRLPHGPDLSGGGAKTPQINIEIPHAADVKRETGLVALKSGEEFGLNIETQLDLQKVDVEEYMQATGAKGTVLPAPPSPPRGIAAWYNIFPV